MGQSLPSKQARLTDVILCGRGDACLPASGPSPSGAALVTAQNHLEGLSSPPGESLLWIHMSGPS